MNHNGISKFFQPIPGLSQAVAYLQYFIIGYLINNVEHVATSNHSRFLKTILATVIVLGLSCLQFFNKLFVDVQAKAVLGITFMYLLCHWLSKWEWFYQNSVFKALLRNSMNIYLIHDPLNFLIIRIANIIGLVNTSVGVIIYFLLRTVGNVVIAVLIGEGLRRLSAEFDFSFNHRNIPLQKIQSVQ